MKRWRIATGDKFVVYRVSLSEQNSEVMRVLIVTQYFYPENFKSNDVAIELAKLGHEVTVLTGLPNYPKGNVYDGYGVFRKRKEIIDGVTVYHTLVIPRGNGGGVMSALNYF